MQRDTDSWKPDEVDCPSKSQAGFTCNGCGGTFQKPILATISTTGQMQKYYACPRCMTEVRNVKVLEKDEEEEPIVSMMEPKKLGTESESRVGCGHFFGYLKKRQKETPFPEECLTCGEMVECLFHDAES